MYPATESAFLTELQKWQILATGTPQQQEEARQWFKDHIQVTSLGMYRVSSPAESIRDFCEHLVDPRNVEERLKIAKLKLADAETVIEILNELESHRALEAASSTRRRRLRTLRAGKGIAQV